MNGLLRSLRNTVAKLFGRDNTIGEGRIGRRVGRRIVGKGTGRLLSRFFH